MSHTSLLTIVNMKPGDEAGGSSIWQGYHPQTSTSGPAQPSSFDPNYSHNLSSLHYQGREKGGYGSLNMPPTPARSTPREGNAVLGNTPPNLNTQHSYPSLKRAFQGSDDSPYGELVQDFREEASDAPRPTINQDHRLLSFAKLPEKHAIIDSHGRVQQVELAAQLHGMFFLSELATQAADNVAVQPELTCYRRNLFQISGNVTTPRGSMIVVTELGDKVAVVSLEVRISATESVDGNSVKLIVIPWKTPPPNSPEVSTGQEQEPAPIPLLPHEEDNLDPNSDASVYPIAYRRLQFRIATANNGRRRELQQHFVLHLNVVGTLANGTKVNVCETSTAPIVVRGRSPRNFQARREIPLVGSSSSRGQPPELHISTSVPQTATSYESKAKPTKSQSAETQRQPFTFDSGNIRGSPSLSRQPNYSTWSATHTAEQSAASATSNYPAASMGIGNYIQVDHSNSELQTTTHPHASNIPAQQTPFRSPYGYPNSAPPTGPQLQFVDSNPRPTKSPRHVAPPELPANTPHQYPDFAARFTTSYSPGQPAVPSREASFFSPSLPMHPQAWSSAQDMSGLYGRAGQPPQPQPPQQHQQGHSHTPNPRAPHYDFPNEGYVKSDDTQAQGGYSWSPT